MRRVWRGVKVRVMGVAKAHVEFRSKGSAWMGGNGGGRGNEEGACLIK